MNSSAQLSSILIILICCAVFCVRSTPLKLNDQTKAACLYQSCMCNSINQVICHGNQSQFPTRNPSAPASLNLDAIEFNQLNFNEIPDEAFHDLSVRYIVFDDNNLTSISKRSFERIKSLINLKLVNQNNLEQIETGSFDALKDSLAVLSLTSSSINNYKYDLFSEELNKLVGIHYLDLSNNNLANLTKNMFSSFKNMLSVDLSGNPIDTIHEKAFDKCKYLASLKLNNANLSKNNLGELAISLFTLTNIKMLELSNNNINEMQLKKTYLLNVEIFTARNSNIEKIDWFNMFFSGGSELKSLDLSDNKLSDIITNGFEQISEIRLTNNYFKSVPSIAWLKKVNILDLANQNGQLTELADYTFDRAVDATSLLNVNLDKNTITKFGDQAFCSKYSTPQWLQSIKFSYSTMLTFNKCYIKQLSRSNSPSEQATLTVGEPEDGTSDYSAVCNCDLAVFARNFNVRLSGICKDFNADQCQNAPFIDDCDPKYTCSRRQLTSTTRVTTSNRNAGHKLNTNYFSNFISSILFILTIFIIKF